MTEKIIFSSESEADKLIRILKDIHKCQEEEKKKSGRKLYFGVTCQKQCLNFCG